MKHMIYILSVLFALLGSDNIFAQIRVSPGLGSTGGFTFYNATYNTPGLGYFTHYRINMNTPDLYTPGLNDQCTVKSNIEPSNSNIHDNPSEMATVESADDNKNVSINTVGGSPPEIQGDGGDGGGDDEDNPANDEYDYPDEDEDEEKGEKDDNEHEDDDKPEKDSLLGNILGLLFAIWPAIGFWPLLFRN